MSLRATLRTDPFLEKFVLHRKQVGSHELFPFIKIVAYPLNLIHLFRVMSEAK